MQDTAAGGPGIAHLHAHEYGRRVAGDGGGQLEMCQLDIEAWCACSGSA